MPNRPYLGGTKYNCLEYEVIATPTNRQGRVRWAGRGMDMGELFPYTFLEEHTPLTKVFLLALHKSCIKTKNGTFDCLHFPPNPPHTLA